RGSDAPQTVFALGPDEHIGLRHDVFAQEALRAAGALADAGVRQGDVVIVCLPTSPEFMTAFFAVMLLGATPVSIALPSRFGGFGGFVSRYRNFAGYLRPRALIAQPPVVAALADETGGDVAAIDGVALRAAAVHGGSSHTPVLPRSDALG